MQSPIDLHRGIILGVELYTPLEIMYRPTSVKAENNGWTIINYCEERSKLLFEEKEYNLLQFHFHSPSEHTINGHHLPFEMHLVHKNENEELLVIAFLFEYGSENTFLKPLWESLPRINETIPLKELINPGQIIPQDSGYFFYNGSLTTPPYTENIKWIIIDKIPSISKDQVSVYSEIFGKPTNRPTQPVENACVTYFKNTVQGGIFSRLSLDRALIE